jgi:outer membrane protein assembly factor BamE (lipoprotein component of BamABCDE complex)
MRSQHLPIAFAAVAILLSSCGKLTPENYAKLKPGLTYGEVTAILGSPARCDDLMGFKSCRWGNDSRNITVRFAGDQIVLYSAENVR